MFWMYKYEDIWIYGEDLLCVDMMDIGIFVEAYKDEGALMLIIRR